MTRKIIDNSGFMTIHFDGNTPKSYTDIINAGIDCGEFTEIEKAGIEQFFKEKSGIYTIDFDFEGEYHQGYITFTENGEPYIEIMRSWSKDDTNYDD